MNNVMNKKYLLSLALVLSPVIQANQKPIKPVDPVKAEMTVESATQPELSDKSPLPLVSAAVRYGMMASAYLNSPSGMVTEGYRFQIRSLYLSYLKEMLAEPGHTVEKINETLLAQWMMRLGREGFGPETLLSIKNGMQDKLAEWSQKSLSGQITPSLESTEIMPKLEQQIKACKRMTPQPSSDPAKRRSCHQAESLTRIESSTLIDPESLKSAMLKLIPSYAQGLIDVSSRPYYRAFITSKEDFQGSVSTLLGQGYTARQLAEILEFAGVDYPEVFNNLYYYALRNDQSIHEPVVTQN
ncbi:MULTISPECIES: hypothetical protein [unclassified Endozoicomonas]|uniref:hypothetical protein n=1 Tax=unclassified Endozoicomonas TaxID=2644528 RepID=UPI003BB61C95